MSSCEKYRQLMMGLLDNELSAEESVSVNDHLIRCARCREEYKQLIRNEENLKMISLTEPEDEVLEKIWKSPYNRFTRVAGLFSVIFGWLLLLVYAIVEMLRASETPFIPKIGVAALFIGFIILLLYVIRERFLTYKIDPYREVER